VDIVSRIESLELIDSLTEIRKVDVKKKPGILEARRY